MINKSSECKESTMMVILSQRINPSRCLLKEKEISLAEFTKINIECDSMMTKINWSSFFSKLNSNERTILYNYFKDYDNVKFRRKTKLITDKDTAKKYNHPVNKKGGYKENIEVSYLLEFSKELNESEMVNYIKGTYIRRTWNLPISCWFHINRILINRKKLLN